MGNVLKGIAIDVVHVYCMICRCFVNNDGVVLMFYGRGGVGMLLICVGLVHVYELSSIAG